MSSTTQPSRFSTKNQIPVEPLASMLEAWCDAQTEDYTTTTYRAVSAPASSLEVERVRTSIRRARKRGYYDLFVADDLSIGVLGLHPCEVYGTEWFEFGNALTSENDNTEEVAA